MVQNSCLFQILSAFISIFIVRHKERLQISLGTINNLCFNCVPPSTLCSCSLLEKVEKMKAVLSRILIYSWSVISIALLIIIIKTDYSSIDIVQKRVERSNEKHYKE